MTRRAAVSLLVLTALAVHVWIRDDAWRVASPDAPALALVFPAIYLLGRPWGMAPPDRGGRPFTHATVAAAALAALGVAFASTLALAAAWCALARVALDSAGIRTAHPRPGALLGLALMGFPWLATDFDAVSWHLRTAAAGAAAAAFAALGLDATAGGPAIYLRGLTLHVDASCSGMGALAALALLAAFLQALPESRPRSPLLLAAAVVSLAFAANVARLVMLGAVAVAGGPAAIQGAAHAAIGLAAFAPPALALVRIAGVSGSREPAVIR